MSTNFDLSAIDQTVELRRKHERIETQVICDLLFKPELFEQCYLNEMDFANEWQRNVFRIAKAINASGVRPDIVNIAEQAEREGNPVSIDDLRTLAINGEGSVFGWKGHFRSAKQNSKLRQTHEVLSNGLTKLHGEDGDEVIDKVLQELMSLSITGRTYSRTIDEVLVDCVKELESRFQKTGTVGITTGIAEMDRFFGGFHESDLVVIGARPAMGKTAFALCLAMNSNQPVGFISAEQCDTQIVHRMIGNKGRINSSVIRNGSFQESDWPRITAGVTTLQGRPIYFNDQPAITSAEVCRQARQWVKTCGIKILFIDYLQLIKHADKRLQRTEVVTENVQMFKALAKELNITVVTLAQVARAVDGRPYQNKGRVPMAHDISDASEVEKTADLILMLYRDEVYNADSLEKGICEVHIPKNRHGEIGFIPTKFEGQFYNFEDLKTYSALEG